MDYYSSVISLNPIQYWTLLTLNIGNNTLIPHSWHMGLKRIRVSAYNSLVISYGPYSKVTGEWDQSNKKKEWWAVCWGIRQWGELRSVLPAYCCAGFSLSFNLPVNNLKRVSNQKNMQFTTLYTSSSIFRGRALFKAGSDCVTLHSILENRIKISFWCSVEKNIAHTLPLCLPPPLSLSLSLLSLSLSISVFLFSLSCF